jgi:hypothetical protein
MGQFENENQTRQLGATGIICRIVSINPPSMATQTLGVGTVAVTGLLPTHRCLVQTAALPAGTVPAGTVVVGARCATPGTLTVDFANPSAATSDANVQNFMLFAIPGDI